MIGNGLSNRERVAAWCRSKKVIIAVVLCIAFIFVFVGIFLSNQASPKSNFESFNCLSSSSGQAFSIDVEVELSDGMDQNEAVNVATCALKSIRAVDPEAREVYFGSSANLGLDGLWTVKLEWTNVLHTFPPGHWSPTFLVISESFEALIDPANRTVVCSSS